MREFPDPIFGTLRPNSERRWWQGTLNRNNQAIQFAIGGGPAPDAALLSHAHEIVNNLADFNIRLDRFLKQEAAVYPGARAEIESLTLEEVCLFWPQRPNDGMIYFSGGQDDRVWRCDYIQREFQMLGCDT